VSENAIGSIQWPIPKNPPIDAKISQISRTQTEFCPKFCSMATGVGREKMQLAAFNGPSPQTPYRRKNLAKISCASRVIAHFASNFIAMAMGGRSAKCDWQHSMAHPRKSPYRRKNLADISYSDRVLSQILFHGNGFRSEKSSLQHSVAHPPNPLSTGAKNLQISFTQAEL